MYFHTFFHLHVFLKRQIILPNDPLSHLKKIKNYLTILRSSPIKDIRVSHNFL